MFGWADTGQHQKLWRAEGAGAQVVSKPEDQFWGDRRYEVALAGIYAAGERIYAAAECRYMQLDTPVRIA